MTVFHLKYRPVLLADLDLANVSSVLSKILAAKEVPQSFLLAGPKGSGKTSAARILARALNCEKPNGVEPCGKCGNCVDISSGSSVDVVEIDAASNRGIDDVRLIKDRAFLLPSRLAKKVVIIDEVHMLTKEAFNALLKLIEEPPKKTTFILCTTDPNKIPETVLSRLVRIDFRKGSREELRLSLNKIIKGEKIKLDEKTIELIVSKSDGSFRNLQRNFYEMYLDLGQDFDAEKVKNYYQTKEGDYSENQLETDLAQGKVTEILQRLEKLADAGVDFSEYRQKLIFYFQKQLLAFWGLGKPESKLTQDELGRLIELLIQVGRWEREVELKQLPLELAIIKFGAKSEVELQDKLVDKKNDIDIKKKIVTNKVVEEVPQKKTKEEVVGKAIDSEELVARWTEILAAVKPFNHSVEAFLRATRPKAMRDNTVVLEVYYAFHKDRLEESRNRKIVEEGLQQVFGQKMLVECVLAKNKKPPERSVDTEVKVEFKPGEGSSGGDMYNVAKEIFG